MILTFSKLYANVFQKKYRGWLIGLMMLISLAVFAIYRNTQPSKNNPTPPQSHAFEPAALLPQAAIWHPAGDNALVYQPYDTEIEPTRLFWMEGVPRQWDVFLIGSTDESAHLLWLNTDGRLWYSQINPDGTQKLLALNLVSGSIQAMTAVRLSDGSLAILWQNERSTLGIIWVDALGRKIAEQTLGNNITHFDIAADKNGTIFLSWASASQGGQAEISVLSLTPDAIGNLDVADASSLSVPIQTSDWLDTLRILVDEEWAYLFWGINSADNPQATAFEVKPFPKSAVRPNTPLPDTTPFALTLAESDESIPLRWAGEVHNWDELRAQLALTAYLDGQWTAVLLNFGDGAYAGYELLSNLPADASQPRILIRYGQRTAAWVHINSAGQLIQAIIR